MATHLEESRPAWPQNLRWPICGRLRPGDTNTTLESHVDCPRCIDLMLTGSGGKAA